MVWTEIVTEDAGITHVGKYQVVFPMGDVERSEVRDVMRMAKQRAGWKYQLEELKELNKTIERNMQAAERLEGTEYEGML